MRARAGSTRGCGAGGALRPPAARLTPHRGLGAHTPLCQPPGPPHGLIAVDAAPIALIGMIAIAFTFVGQFWFNLVESVATFSTLIDTFSCPWMATDGDRLRDASPPLSRGRPAGVQPRAARRPTLVRACLEPARDGRVVSGGVRLAVVREPAGPVRRGARQPRGRARSQRAGVAGGRRAAVFRAADDVSGSGVRVWSARPLPRARRQASGARSRHPGDPAEGYRAPRRVSAAVRISGTCCLRASRRRR